MTVFNSKVITIGAMASDFLNQNMLITFGESVPAELSDFCYIIENYSFSEEIVENDILQIGDNDYFITAVGSKVKENLINLGHITISFSGDKEAALPGTLYVQQKDISEISVGTPISIRKEN